MGNHILKRLIPLLLLASCSEPYEERKLPNLSQSLVIEVLSDTRASQQLLVTQLLLETRKLNQLLQQGEQPDLELLRDQWTKAHDAFIRLNFFSLARIDTTRVDAWPIYEGFIDSLPGYPDSGIINDTTIELSRASLLQQHGITANSEASIGFHPLEFMLFARTDAHYLEPIRGDRRKNYLRIATTLLEDEVTLFVETHDRLYDDYLEQVNTNSQPEIQLLILLSRLHFSIVSLFAEANQFQQTISGHGQRSGSTKSTLRAQLEQLQTISGPDTKLAGILKDISDEVSDEYQLTLERALALIRNEMASDDELTQLPLFVAAMGHQLEDFIRPLAPAEPDQDLLRL